jgi:hypothetical protein
MNPFARAGSRLLRRVVPLIALGVSGVVMSQTATENAHAWSFGESPTAAFAVDGFAGASGEGSGQSQAIEDASGNIFRFGSTAGTIDVDPGVGTTLVGDAVTDSVFYVAKYSSTGSFLWAHDWKPAGSNELVITDMSVGPDGYLIVGGYVSAPSGMDLDPTSGGDVVTSTAVQPFLLRLNADGSYGWGETFVVSSGAEGSIGNLSVSSTGAITATVYFENTLTLFGASLVSAGGKDVVIMRLNANATSLTWSTTVAGDGLDWASDLKVLSDGRVFVSGGFASTSITVTGSDAATSTVTKSASASQNSYFVSLNSSGVVQYAVPRSIMTQEQPHWRHLVLFLHSYQQGSLSKFPHLVL